VHVPSNAFSRQAEFMTAENLDSQSAQDQNQLLKHGAQSGRHHADCADKETEFLVIMLSANLVAKPALACCPNGASHDESGPSIAGADISDSALRPGRSVG